MKPCRHITAGMNHIFDLHTQVSQLMILDPGHSIQYASLLYGKLGDEMEGRFNQDLPESLQAAFEKAMNFKPCIFTKQTIIQEG